MSSACFSVSAWREAGDQGCGEAGDGGCGADRILIGEHGNGGAIVDENMVVGDEAGDFAAVLDVAMAVQVAHFNAEAVVGILAVFQLHLGEHLFVAFGLEDSLGDQAFIPEREVVRGHGQVRRLQTSSRGLLWERRAAGRGRGDSRRWHQSA